MKHEEFLKTVERVIELKHVNPKIINTLHMYKLKEDIDNYETSLKVAKDYL